MKFSPLTASLVVLFAVSRTIFADIIILKNGKTWEGKVLASDDDVLVLYDFEKERRIRTEDIRSVEMGFSGIPVCTENAEKPTPDCDKFLHSLGDSQIIFVYGKGLMETEFISSRDILSLEWKRKSPQDRFLPYLRSPLSLQIKTQKTSLGGVVREINSDKKTFLFWDESANEETIIQETDVIGFIWKRPPSFWDNVGYKHILVPIPGAVQIQQGDTLKGSIIAGIALVSGVGAYSEFQSSVKKAETANLALPLGNQLVIYEYPPEGNAYKSHLQNSRILGGIFLLTLFYHFWDVRQYFSGDQNLGNFYPYEKYARQGLGMDSLPWSMNPLSRHWNLWIPPMERFHSTESFGFEISY